LHRTRFPGKELFQPGDLIILAARPSMGKTSLAMNIAENVALGEVADHERRAVAIFSLEMSRESLVKRLLCSRARVPAGKLFGGYISNEHHGQLVQAADALSQASIFVDDSSGLSPVEVRARARRLKRKHNIALVVVDYLQLITPPPDSENRTQEISQISRALKMLAKELDVPVIALSQLSRSVEQRTDKRPLLSDLRESGSIEQDADVVMFIYRPEYYEGAYDESGAPKMSKESNLPLDGLAEVIISKHRNGPTGMSRLNFRKQFTRFESYTSRTAG